MFTEHRTSDIVLIAAGAALWALGTKTFAEHERTTGSLETVAGIGMLVYGTYRANETWGKGLGAVLGALVLYNAYEHKTGEDLLPAFPVLGRA